MTATNEIPKPDAPLVCSICFRPIPLEYGGWRFGRNAEPVNDGRCCSDCDTTIVIPARLRAIYWHNKK